MSCDEKDGFYSFGMAKLLDEQLQTPVITLTPIESFSTLYPPELNEKLAAFSKNLPSINGVVPNNSRPLTRQQRRAQERRDAKTWKNGEVNML